MVSEELEKLNTLKERGVLSEEEFELAKQKVLDEPVKSFEHDNPLGIDEKTYCILLHLSQFTPGVSFMATVVLWLIGKERSEEIDWHGKMILNWIISAFIYGGISFVFCVVIIGYFMGVALAVACVVFPIIGAVKANDGERYEYPMVIKFIK